MLYQRTMSHVAGQTTVRTQLARSDFKAIDGLRPPLKDKSSKRCYSFYCCGFLSRKNSSGDFSS